MGYTTTEKVIIAAILAVGVAVAVVKGAIYWKLFELLFK